MARDYTVRCCDRYIAIDLEMRAEDAYSETGLEKKGQSDKMHEKQATNMKLVSDRRVKLACDKWRQGHILHAAAARDQVLLGVFVAGT